MKFLILLTLSTQVFALNKSNTVQDCKEIAKGPCYEFPGRARLYSNKYMRVWKKGSRRLYEITNHTAKAFYDLKHLNMATEIHAMFDVCFLKPEVPSGFSSICVQSVKDMETSYVPE